MHPEDLIIITGDQPILSTASQAFDFVTPPWDPLWLAKSLARTMFKANGLGLAAVQCGFPTRVFVLKIGSSWRAHFNPVLEIDAAQSDTTNATEGCLSFPGMQVAVSRPNKIFAKFQDEFGRPRQIVYRDMEARAFCHELDHLAGVTLQSRIKAAQRRNAGVDVSKPREGSPRRIVGAAALSLAVAAIGGALDSPVVVVAGEKTE